MQGAFHLDQSPGRTTLRALIFAAWIVGSIAAWLCVLIFVGHVIAHLVNERQALLPTWCYVGLSYGAIAGTVLIPALVAIFALRGKLPGTIRIKGAAA